SNSSLKYISNILQIMLQPILQVLSFRTLSKAERVIVINEYTRSILLSKGISNEKIVVIPPGIDTINNETKSDKMRDSKVIEIITVGYLMKRKGVDLIIKAVASVVKTHKNVRLRIIGDGPQRESLEKLVR